MADALENILAANLAQLRRTEPELAQRLAEATPAPLDWSQAQSGLPTAALREGERTLWLASRYDPKAEAAKLTAHVDHKKHAGLVVLGLALGYQVTKLAQEMSDSSLLIVFEPDLSLLRAVLEKIDHTAWLGRANVVLADAELDRAGLLARIERFGTVLTQGTVLVTHPFTRQRHPEAVKAFGQTVAEVLAYFRTNVATTLVNAARTVRNLSLNLPHYVAGADTQALYQAAKGYPAVCVGAGPSLAKNVDLLRDPQVRGNVVLISAQTTLKPLLDRGIRPDFVTALDYHEISRRFYEGVGDLPEVTLVAEAKVHSAVLEAFPGPVRLTRDRFLDRLLGPLGRSAVFIRDGATVAHLSFYLAQHLGCDPIILIGQDLGFSDGLYYCPGTAIHDVWAPELSPFSTLEMMEWQRIVRHRSHLQKLTDVHGRPIYSDEQMLTYLKQFERDFAEAKELVLDATEGGLPKEHATAVSLREALATHATRPVPQLPRPPRQLDRRRLGEAATLLRQRLADVAELRQLTRLTEPILKDMLDAQRNARRMEKLFARLKPMQDRVAELADTFTLLNDLNTIGVFKRARADRAIHHGQLDPLDRQRQQLERDLENLNWIVQACDEATRIFEDALTRLELFGTGPS